MSILLLTVSTCLGQNLLVPGEQIFDERWMKDSKFEMSYWAIKDNQKIEIGSFEVALNIQKNQFSVATKLQFINSDETWIDTCISDKSTFRPIYRASYNKDRDFAINYQNVIKGFYFDKKSKKRKIVNEALKEDFFDFYNYPYLLSYLPLATGYKKDLVVYDYKPANSNNIKKQELKK